MVRHSYEWSVSPFRVILAQKQFGLERSAVASAQHQVATTVPPDLGGRVANAVVVSLEKGS